MNNLDLKRIIKESQHCHRNWDLTKKIPEEHIDILKTAVKECPSKQNRVFYSPVFITDRDVIEYILETTKCFVYQWDPRLAVTNSQIMANLLVVFVRDRDYSEKPRTEVEHTMGVIDGKNIKLNPAALLDEGRAVGIASAYLTLTAHLLGYKTGFYNGRHSMPETTEMFGEEVLLMVGVGFEDHARNSHEHHFDSSFIFSKKPKKIIVKDGNSMRKHILSVDISKVI